MLGFLRFSYISNVKIYLLTSILLHSEVYGNPLICPQPESYFGNVNPYGPRSCYDEGKRVAEAMCYAYQQSHNIDIRIARIFNAYGPGMPASDGRVVSNFIAAAMKCQPINITGDGSAVRCFQYVTDCVSGLTKLMASDYCQPINIGNDSLCRIDHLAHVVVDLVKKNRFRVLDDPITYSAMPVDDPVQRQPDITLAKEVLNWTPVVSLEEGIQKTIDWFLSTQDSEVKGASTRAATTEKQSKAIPFNIPPIIGTELANIRTAIQNESLSGAGTFSRNCQKWLQETLQCGPVTLTASGTTALEMAALVLGIQPGDEVIMPSYTYVSTSNAFILRGAAIVFVDIRPDNMNIDETKIEAAITSKTRAIVPVHYAGNACEMDSIMALAKKHKLIVVEDAAQALLSTYKGRALGSIGHIGCVSFHESKNVTSGGQGGAVLINDVSLRDKADLVAEKGTDRSAFLKGGRKAYTWQCIGSSFCMSEIQAAYLWSQLQCAEGMMTERMRLWSRYQVLLRSLGEKGWLVLPGVEGEGRHNAHIFYLRLKDAEECGRFVGYMKGSGISTLCHYSALHACEPGKRFGRFKGEDRFTTRESERLVRLPLFRGMGEDIQDRVVRGIEAFFGTKHGGVRL
jgi:dTDP-4-amino-4,6-dideoxygalactose transaminase